MAYTDAEKVRELMGVTIDDAPDSLLENFITYSQEVLLRRLVVRVIDEEISGTIDATNTKFTINHPFIADTNFDKIIDKNDIKIYGWADEFASSKTELSVDSLYPLNGEIILSTAPAVGQYYQITCDYSYYVTQIDWTLVELATSYHTAMMWVGSEVMLVPVQHVIGRMRIKHGNPWEFFRNEFERIVHLLQSKAMDSVTYSRIVLTARGETSSRQAGKAFNWFDPDKELV